MIGDTASGWASLRGRRVLVVEDEQLIAWDVCEALREAGALVMEPRDTVESALDALASEAAPDIALLDVSLVDHELVFAVAEQLTARQIPFVFYSGHSSAIVEQRFVNATYCQKPMDGNALAAALEATLRRDLRRYSPRNPTH
jgi:DNA-binding response OmpR family regulator